MSKSLFGEIDGAPVYEAVIRSKAGVEAKILTYGAVVRDLIVPAAAGAQRVTLGLNSIEDYVAHSPHFGAVPGRFANRIAGGRFVLDGVAHTLDRKPGDRNTLHGGPHGFGTRIWTLARQDEVSVVLTLEIARWRRRFPGRARGDLRLSPPRTRDAAGRADGDGG